MYGPIFTLDTVECLCAHCARIVVIGVTLGGRATAVGYGRGVEVGSTGYRGIIGGKNGISDDRMVSRHLVMGTLWEKQLS